MLKKIMSFIAAVVVFASFPANALATPRNELLLKGDRDQYVLELQKALKEQGYLKHKPTGYFGTDTEDALLAFQKAHGLKADGKAGPQTRKALLGDKYKPITKKRNVKDAATGEEKSDDKLYPGDKGDDVKELQKSLKDLGYYKYSKITGYYGPSTKEAVQRFQRTNELTMDGVAGPATLKLLKSGDAKYYTIYYKDKGDDVKDMQKRLKALGYYKSSLSGFFNTATLTALKAFQKNNGLKADGKAGKQTLEKLYSGKAKKAGTSSNAPDKKPKPKPEPEPEPEAGGKTRIEKLINYAKTHVGKKYRRGAEGPDRFDCSGFTMYCFKYVGVKITRTSASQSQMTKYKKIEKISDLKPGDLMFFKTQRTSGVGHAGIYIGNNKFIHSAPNSGVEIRTLSAGQYYYRQFKWGRRVFAEEA